MTPRAAMSSSARLAFLVSPDKRYKRILVSKKTSATLMCFQPVKLEIGRQTASVLAQPRQQFPRARGPGDLKRPPTHHVNFDRIPFVEPEQFNYRLRQTNGETVTPFSDPHGSPQYTRYVAYILSAGLYRVQSPFKVFGPLFLSRIGVQANNDILQWWRRGRITSHHQRVVAGYDMVARIGQTLNLAKRIEHRAYVERCYKRPIGFEIFVKMTGVRRE